MWNKTTLISSTEAEPCLSGTLAQKISAKQHGHLELLKKINLIQKIIAKKPAKECQEGKFRIISNRRKSFL
jgi:hypothetical protein